MPTHNLHNELLVWVFLKDLCLEKLPLYQTTLEQDIEILKQDDITFNKRNCVLIRKGEKEILHYFIFCADTAVQLSKLSKKEAKE